MALAACARAIALRTSLQSFAVPVAAAAGPRAVVHASSRAEAEPAAPGADPFTSALQEKTQRELMELLERNRVAAAERQRAGASLDARVADAGADAAADADAAEADAGEYENPETGEVAGYRGPEATRFGDWEHRGRCTDF